VQILLLSVLAKSTSFTVIMRMMAYDQYNNGDGC
jgi:hypothetical protein